MLFMFFRMCPFCRQDAPIVYRGVVPYCTACGRVRAPLASRSINMAGKASVWGGTAAHAIGWLVLGIGTALTLGFAAVAYALFTMTTALIVGVPLELVALTIGLLLVRGGRSLQRSGTSAQRDTRAQAIFALAQNRGGILTALDVAQAVGIRADDADLLMTELAKTQPEQCMLEVDDNGAIYYRFANAPWTADPRYRVEPSQAAPALHDASASASQARGEVIDAELIEEPARGAQRSVAREPQDPPPDRSRRR